MRSAEIRETFLTFFEKRGHTRVPSASLIPANDPTLYFTNAGMVPFKGVFLGEERRDTVRAASSQKCMRVSGKHNDLENVGLTPRHHTFFEMLGNFSFGDYFKKEAIGYAWEFLTEILKLDKSRLYITVFEKDDEAARLWEAHVPSKRIFRLSEKDNFWSMGETGPCGPCSEIHWDFRPEDGNVTKESFETVRFFEVWNLVFMEYNRDASGKMTKLPKPSIDTGMGLERLACLLQQKESNWETDLFLPIISKIESVTGKKSSESEANRVAMCVIADHVRCAVFLISDGVLPSNEGRGYVLRRILRRAIRYARNLEVGKPVLASVSGAVFQEMGEAYPEIVQHRVLVEKALQNEEESFLKTLQSGMEILEIEFERLGAQKVLPGEIVFKLYDTFGFPKDLTELIAREKGIALDEAGFEKEMLAQQERGRKAWKGEAAKKVTPVIQTIYQQGGRTGFFYDRLKAEEPAIRLIHDGKEVDRVGVGEGFQLVTPYTPFYAEGGGQVGDTGTLLGRNLRGEVLDTQKPYPDLFVHAARVLEGEITRDQSIHLQVDRERRLKIRRHHSATHLLHAALRQILGEHVKQAGSYLDETHLRFDFSHFEAIHDGQLADIETRVNKIIAQKLKVTTEVLPYAEAIAKGALAFFGEKYGETVRMVKIDGFSVELCGGTHCDDTGEIGLFKIMKERSVASGVRRIEAISGEGAVAFQQRQAEEEAREAALKKEFQMELREKKQVEGDRLRNAIAGLKELSPLREIGGAKVFAQVIDVGTAAELRIVADHCKQKIGSGVVVLGAEIDGKAALVVTVTSDLTETFHAGKIVQKLAQSLGGKGGGRPDMAQGGAPHVSRLRESLKNLSQGAIQPAVTDGTGHI